MTSISPSPVTVSVLWNSLLSIADEMGGVLRRTAVSAAVREGEDFSTALFDHKGRLIAQGNFTPGHLGAMPYVVANVLDWFPPETLIPGDSILLNDSFLGSGHYPDFFLVSPVFFDSKLLGFTVNTAHHVDVGGAAPGSQQVHGVTEAYQEGLRVLPVKIVKGGEIDADLMSVILGNVRAPDILRSDIQAQINANFVGAQRFTATCQEYGLQTLTDSIESILSQSEAKMRGFIRALPDGKYDFEDVLDDCGEGHEIIKVAVDIEINGDKLVIDFSRSSDAIDTALNSYINYTRAYSMFAIKVFAGAVMPQNDGMIRPIEVTAREGSFFNPKFPSPSGGRAAVQIRIFDVINGAMSKAIPERAMGAFSHWSNPNISGIDDETGETFIMYDLIFGGYGGRSFRDGVEAMAPVMNCTNIPIEVQETLHPVHIHRLELIPDTGGIGKYRGGCGIRKDIELLSQKAVMTLLCDRHVKPPFGLFGGGDGSLAQTLLIRDGATNTLSSKETVKLMRGDIVSFRLSGGGGYGNAKERDHSAINFDIENGFITLSHAQVSYGTGGELNGNTTQQHAKGAKNAN